MGRVFFLTDASTGVPIRSVFGISMPSGGSFSGLSTGRLIRGGAE
jgi:hypothetical protein